MPIIPVNEHQSDQMMDTSLFMNAPFLWDTDTLCGICGNLLFDDITNGETVLTPPERALLSSANAVPTRYEIYARRNSFIYMRVRFEIRIPNRAAVDVRQFYLKARDPRFIEAFAMGTHPRLGERSLVRSLPPNLDANIMQTIQNEFNKKR